MITLWKRGSAIFGTNASYKLLWLFKFWFLLLSHLIKNHAFRTFFHWFWNGTHRNPSLLMQLLDRIDFICEDLDVVIKLIMARQVLQLTGLLFLFLQHSLLGQLNLIDGISIWLILPCGIGRRPTLIPIVTCGIIDIFPFFCFQFMQFTLTKNNLRLFQ